MKFQIRLCIGIALLMSVHRTGAQDRPLKFNEVPGKDVIKLGKINSITSDIHGVMWFSDQTSRSIITYCGSAPFLTG